MTQPASPEILHGGAERLAIRWVNRADPPAKLSRYSVSAGQSVSLHVHTGKTEYWVILTGTGVARVGEAAIPVGEGDVIATPPHVPHALTNTGAGPLQFLNIVQLTGDLPVTTVELPG
ncbi:MAG: cupin [Rhodovulum sulfidophilum]|uniref:Cupin n=1 Tax=Rhodovulum sulfidophilum TaxID=35806 RepID=A0A2W5Q9T0_RHOSU|nr:MAG: cupin [Rhodovulum sulfidophilum]